MRKAAAHLPDEISIVWSIEDIKERDDQELLSEDDCREILDAMKRTHDANIGINWEVIDIYIENFLSERD